MNQTAKVSINSIAEYLESEFSYQAAANFVGNVYESIDKIKAHPTRGRTVPTSKT